MPKGIKAGGRKRGVPNRRTLDLANQLEAMGYDLVAETMKNLARVEDPYRAAQIQVRMFAYMYPTRGPQPGPSGETAVDVTPETAEATEEEIEAALLLPVKPA